MKPLNIDPKWLLSQAAKENNTTTSVAGLFLILNTEQTPQVSPPTEAKAFARLIQLMRRERNLTEDALSKLANIEIQELREIESGLSTSPEPRTVYMLAETFGLPAKQLMQLSGLVAQRDKELDEAAVRFAASSNIGELSKQEREQLEEFVSIIASR